MRKFKINGDSEFAVISAISANSVISALRPNHTAAMVLQQCARFIKLAERCDWLPRCNTSATKLHAGPCSLAAAPDLV